MAILRRLSERRALSPNTLFRTGLDTLDMGATHAGVTVTADSALTYSGIWACVRLITSDISTLPLDAYRKTATARVPLDPQPTWIAQPDVLDPSYTGIDHFAQVVLSLLLDGNSFTLATPSVYKPDRLEVLNPRRVQVTKPGTSPEYRIMDRNGMPGEEVLGPADVLHVKINAKPGAIRGMSPVDANAGSISISLAAQKYVERFFGQGAMMPGFIEVPASSDVEEMRKDFQRQHGGWRRSGLAGFLTGGAKWTPSGITPKDQELGEVFRRQLEEAARVYGIPPFMVGSQEPAGVAYASSVERAQHYIDHCLRHYVLPIEKAYDRMVPGDRRLSIAGSDTYLKFNFNGLLRGDLSARNQAYRESIQNGILSQDEVRALEDLEPIPGGKGAHYWMPINFAPLDQPILPAGATPLNAPGTALPADTAPAA